MLEINLVRLSPFFICRRLGVSPFWICHRLGVLPFWICRLSPFWSCRRLGVLPFWFYRRLGMSRRRTTTMYAVLVPKGAVGTYEVSVCIWQICR